MSEAGVVRASLERQKVRAAEWLYRWNLSSGIVGIVFSILTFMGVFTLVLGPALSQFGLSYLETALILFVIVVASLVGFGVFLDVSVKFWSAQATVGTVRNPYLVDMLYQKELLTLLYINRPLLRSVRALLDDEATNDKRRREIACELDHALAKVEAAIRDKRWPIESGERVY